MVTDPISDMLAQIKNGYLAKKPEVSVYSSKLKETIAKVLADEKYIESYEVVTNGSRKLNMKLKYQNKEPAITEILRVSRPSLRVYANKANLPRILGGMGVAIISTPFGLMTDKQARKKNTGGEVICKIW